MEKTEVLSVRLPAEYIQHLKKMAHKLSLERNEDLRYSDLMREAIMKAFPLNQKGDKK